MTYTISPFIHVPFLQHNNSKSATNEIINNYSKTVAIGDNTITVSYVNHDSNVPCGIYPRRLFSALCKFIVSTKYKSATIKLPSNKNKFIKEILKINYVCGKKDTQLINEQLKAFANCEISIQYSNPNETTRQPRNSIKFFADDCSWLYDDVKSWQSEITLSQNMFNLIKHTRVPISAHAVDTFTSSRKLDIFNYFSYQNYNLYQKQLNHLFEIDNLFYLFGGEIQNIKDFKRSLSKVIKDLAEVSYLDLHIQLKNYYKLSSNDRCLLKQQERRKTNIEENQLLKINDEFKAQLNKKHDQLEIDAACIYVTKQVTKGKVRHVYAYLRDVLRNKFWYAKERTELINTKRRECSDEYNQINSSIKEQGKSIFKNAVKNTFILSVPAELRDQLKLLQTPSKNTPSLEYIAYLYWIYNYDKFAYFNDNESSQWLKLFKYLG